MHGKLYYLSVELRFARPQLLDILLVVLHRLLHLIPPFINDSLYLLFLLRLQLLPNFYLWIDVYHIGFTR